MFSQNVLEMLEILIDNGIEVSLHKREDGVYFADLHTRAKSHLHLSEQNGEVIFDMRYEKREALSSEEEPQALVYHAAACYAYQCICGRNFGGEAWDKLCTDLDITVSYGDL